MIAYTPETYVVNYGTDMNTLNSMSKAVSSGSDFELNELILSVELLDLLPGTIYYYQLVANNTFNANESSVEKIQTREVTRKSILSGYMSEVTCMLDIRWYNPNP